NLGYSLAYAWLGVVAHLAMAWPTGRVTGRGDRALLACCYLAAIGTQALRVVLDHPRPPASYDTPYVPSPASISGSIAVLALALVVGVLTVRRWLAAPGVRRRWRRPVWAMVLTVAVPAASTAIASITRAPIHVENVLLLITVGTAVLFVPV